MTISTDQINELHELTEYERWSLTGLAELSGNIKLEKYTVETLAERSTDREITSDGQRIGYLRARASIGSSGVDQVISDITPLIFASSYKCLDLFVEWFLEINGKNPTGSNDKWTFENKADELNSLDLNNNPNIPSIFETDSRIFRGISNIYTELKDYRHSIIHDMNFKINNSKLIINNGDDDSYMFGGEELFSFAGVVSVCIDTIITDTYDYVTVRQLATMLDNLSYVHSLPNFDLTDYQSSIIRVRMEPIETDPYRWEPTVKQINNFPPVDEGSGDFWLNLVGLHNENVINEWMIPSDRLTGLLESGFDVSSGDFQEYTI